MDKTNQPGPDPQQTDDRIRAALLAVMGSGLPLTHDAVAAEAGVSRRTVYRRYPDQASLRQEVWTLLSPRTVMRGNLAWLLEQGLRDSFESFDSHAATMTVAMASAEGRAVRNQQTAARTAYYREIYGRALADVPEPQRTRAIAIMQLLTSGLAWREMRDQWGFKAPDMAEAARWAIKALLRDLGAKVD